MKCAIAQNSASKDVATLHQDIWNCPRHCFRDHQQCRTSYCKHAGEGNGGKQVYYYTHKQW